MTVFEKRMKMHTRCFEDMARNKHLEIPAMELYTYSPLRYKALCNLLKKGYTVQLTLE